jgi:CHASE3 domain sensor protein
MNDQKRDTRAALISLIFSLVLLIVYGFALWYTDQKILASSTRNIVNATQSVHRHIQK